MFQTISREKEEKVSVPVSAGINVPVDKCMAEDTRYFQGSSKWQDVLALFKNMAEEELQPEKAKLKSEFMTNIHKEKLNQGNCYGCTQFYFDEMNILDDSICSIPVRTFDSIKNIRSDEARLKF